jgi:hypothetical protein
VFGVTPGTNWDSPGAGLVARDGVWGLPNEAGYNNIVSATHAEKNGSFLQQAGHVLTTINRTVILSDLYTDADANATAVTTTTPGLVAFNSERANNGYVDLKATLAYTLAFDNLMFGQNYIATVTWVTSGGVATVHSYPFTAGGSMHTITDNVTLPPNGEFLVVMLPTIQSA